MRHVGLKSVFRTLEIDELIWGALWKLGMGRAPVVEYEEYGLLGQLTCALRVLHIWRAVHPDCENPAVARSE